MGPSPKSFDPNALASLAGLEVRARRLVDGSVGGRHRGPLRGFSSEFAEHREYAPGDDPRRVDWKVYGKTDKLYLKQFEQETSLVCYLAVDSSASMAYRGPSAPWSKWDCARTLAAALGFVVLRRQDSAGLALYSAGIEAVVEADGSAAQWTALVHTLERAEAGGRDDFSQSLRRLADGWTRRGVVTVIGDLFGDPDEILLGLARFAHRGHDLMVLQIVDPAEVDFPFDLRTHFRGLEGETLATVDAGAMRDAYRSEFAAHGRMLQAGCRELGADFLTIRTDESLELVLRRFLADRIRR